MMLLGLKRTFQPASGMQSTRFLVKIAQPANPVKKICCVNLCPAFRFVTILFTSSNVGIYVTSFSSISYYSNVRMISKMELE